MECAENGLRPGEREATEQREMLEIRNARAQKRAGSPGLGSRGWKRVAGGTEVFWEPSGSARPRTPLFKRLGGPLTLFFISNSILI